MFINEILSISTDNSRKRFQKRQGKLEFYRNMCSSFTSSVPLGSLFSLLEKSSTFIVGIMSNFTSTFHDKVGDTRQAT